MRRGVVSGRASAAALALAIVVSAAPPALAAGDDATRDAAPAGALPGSLGIGRAASEVGAPLRRTPAAGEEPGDEEPGDAAPTAAERAESDPVATLEAGLAAAGDGYDGFIVVVEDVGILDHVRSLLTRGRPADALDRGGEAVEAIGGRVERNLDGLLRAVVADLTVAEARALALDPAVRWISPNALVTLGSRRIVTDASHAFGNLFLWNLAVSDSAAADWAYLDYTALDRSYRFSSEGAGVDVFIVDSGIDAANVDIAARVVPSTEYSGGYFRISTDTVAPDADCNGHGTHVAGTVAGAASGIARGARVVPVKVFPDCARTTGYDNIIDGLSWIATQVAAAPERAYVVNMSLGGGASATLDAAVEALIGTDAEPGVTVVVAAGNDNIAVSLVSPARVADAITVGALGTTYCANQACDSTLLVHNERANYSNYGAGIDVMAPGTTTWSACAASNLLGAEFDTDGNFVRSIQKDCTAVVLDGVTYQLTAINGTSMAAPLVAGLAARYLGEEFAADGTIATPAQVRAAIVGGGIAGVLTEVNRSLGSSPNLVANTRFLEPTPTSPRVPVVTACSGGAASSGLLQLPDEGVGPFTWSVTAGTLPDGLTLSADGRITGSTTPATQVGTVTLQVEDPFGRTSSATFGRSAFPAGCTG